MKSCKGYISLTATLSGEALVPPIVQTGKGGRVAETCHRHILTRESKEKIRPQGLVPSWLAFLQFGEKSTSHTPQLLLDNLSLFMTFSPGRSGPNQWLSPVHGQLHALSPTQVDRRARSSFGIHTSLLSMPTKHTNLLPLALQLYTHGNGILIPKKSISQDKENRLKLTG